LLVKTNTKDLEVAGLDIMRWNVRSLLLTRKHGNIWLT